MEPEDDCLLRVRLCGLEEPRRSAAGELRLEDAVEAERRRVRFVCTDETSIGVVGRERRAAAAAAALREVVEEFESRRKAVRAAVVAEGEMVETLGG